MPTLLLEEVFKVQGIPEHNFVVPSHANRLKVALMLLGEASSLKARVASVSQLP